MGRKLQGVEIQGGKVWQFRGIQYARIPYRFANPVQLERDEKGQREPPVLLDCTSFGPRCPQNPIDHRHLLRVPGRTTTVPVEAEDEFACLNLDVTIPATAFGSSTPSLPVFVWIHGGSQTVSFGTSSSGLCDPSDLVAKSKAQGQPIVAVNINYRLNMFAFGDGASTPNLALRDQCSALEYVGKHIAGFGGDPERITLAGESAGAVYCHAHMMKGDLAPPVRSWVLQSGTLALSPPQPDDVADALIARVGDTLHQMGGWTVRDAPVSELLAVQAELGVSSLYLRMEEKLSGWESAMERKCGMAGVERLLIGDTEYESVLWRNGIETMTAASIVEAFDVLGEEGSEQVRSKYGIYHDRDVACKLGALDFLHDMRFSLPTQRMVRAGRFAGAAVMRYLMDEPNPWQRSSRAHHGVDLLYLFNHYNLGFSCAAENIVQSIQDKWIAFINGDDPWPVGEEGEGERAWAFGPSGECLVVGETGLGIRRRVSHMSLLEEIGLERAEKVVKLLATGRSSLLN
ncbi:Alpha/Beta hydrolase protein [Microdochium bolleyi]|uniref:Carboxylic ester hydrolase n=1 Tax=Microdochium bolleyi TaxID=196109 RepID=A0A136ISJ6_9PEZI|nr:Alpha/Beta hydrolase protein [Microdochium bolleyi]